jgi:hypothetical protein
VRWNPEANFMLDGFAHLLIFAQKRGLACLAVVRGARGV